MDTKSTLAKTLFNSLGRRQAKSESCKNQSMNTDERIVTLDRIRKFSYLMDSAFRIPVIGFRFGLDPIIGLIPGAGDLVSTAFSAYIIYLATRFRLPPQVL